MLLPLPLRRVRCLALMLPTSIGCTSDDAVADANDGTSGGATQGVSDGTANTGTTAPPEPMTTSGPTVDTSSGAGGSTSSAPAEASSSDSGSDSGGTPPLLAVDDTFFTRQGIALVVGEGGLTANDQGGPAPPTLVTAFDVVSLRGASVDVEEDGRFRYAADEGLWGPDQFTYTVEDATGETDTATVTVFVAPQHARLAAVADGVLGFAIDAVDQSDQAGASVAAAGDVNGDGLDDIIVGAPGASPTGPLSGEAYVIFGKTSTAPVLLAELGDHGFAIRGASSADLAGTAVAGAGDVNGDGLADVIVGAHGADPDGSSTPNSGSAYVVFGKADTDPVELGALGEDGFVIEGDLPGDVAGEAVAGAGDVNGDGLDDVLVGADEAGPSFAESGRAYLVYGKADSEAVFLESLGSDGIYVEGAVLHDATGRAVSGVGDLNDDGLTEIVVASIGHDGAGENRGRTDVIFGAEDLNDLDLPLPEGAGYSIDGAQDDGWSGWEVRFAGDVNGDGLGDLAIAIRNSHFDGLEDRRSYVVFGKADHAAVELGELGAAGFEMLGENRDDGAGRSIGGGTDFDSDGRDDVIVGAQFANGGGHQRGRSYVVYGRASTDTIDLGEVSEDVFWLDGEDDLDWSGAAVAGAGDVNGDGHGDLLVGSFRHESSGPFSGRVYVVFGVPRADTCCREHRLPGCTDRVVEDCVCDVDEACCAQSWDASCVEAASAQCGACAR